MAALVGDAYLADLAIAVTGELGGQAGVAPRLYLRKLLLAPTAGGKTEAAVFPVLSRMAAQRWDGLSVLYLCPLKALLNNLLPRLEVYGSPGSGDRRSSGSGCRRLPGIPARC
jgi:hypothetical protein